MTRLITCGFEMQSNTAEFFAVANGPAFSTATPRSGNVCGRILTPTSGTARSWQLSWKQDLQFIFIRFYLRITTNPNVGNQILRVMAADLNGVAGSMALNSDGTLTLQRSDGAGIGVASPVLNTGQWYRVELHLDKTGANGSHIMRARVDGIEFTSVTNLTLAYNMGRILLGANLENGSCSAGQWLYDDVAVNDGDGTAQNTYPGEGKVVAFRPNAAGDSNTFDTPVGGTSSALSDNYSRVNETPPNNDTSYNASKTANQEDLFECPSCADVGIGPNDTISWVGVGGLWRHEAFGSSGSFKYELMKASGGTKMVTTTGITFGNNSYHPIGGTNDNCRYPAPAPASGHLDPDGNPWTPSTLDTMQIGYKMDTGGASNTRMSALWATVEYVAAPVVEKAYGYVY